MKVWTETGQKSRQPLLIVLLAAFVLAGCDVDPRQSRICSRVATLLADPGTSVEIMETEPTEGPDFAVRVRYYLIGEAGTLDERWIACAFAGRGFAEGRFVLTEVLTSHKGPLSVREMFWLDRVLGLKSTPRFASDRESVDAITPGLDLELLYFLQQLINAIVLGAVYGLVAVSFTLVYGIVRQINFAFGEIYMIGAIGTVLWTVFFATLGAAGFAAALGAVLVMTASVAALYGWASDRLVFRPLRRVRSHAPLIAAIGLAIFLQEYVRLLHTGRDFWLPPDFTDGVVLAEASGFTLYASLKQVGILALTGVIWIGLAKVIKKTAFGRAHRAAADDGALAELMGVDVDRTVARTFALGGLCAGIAGFIIVEYYGVANFFMGLMLGFKALTAAIIGGIGSVTGALWGAMVLALVEVYWSAYLSIAWKDVAVFSLLILVLVFRPDGLLGVPRGRGD